MSGSRTRGTWCPHEKKEKRERERERETEKRKKKMIALGPSNKQYATKR